MQPELLNDIVDATDEWVNVPVIVRHALLSLHTAIEHDINEREQRREHAVQSRLERHSKAEQRVQDFMGRMHYVEDTLAVLHSEMEVVHCEVRALSTNAASPQTHTYYGSPVPPRDFSSFLTLSSTASSAESVTAELTALRQRLEALEHHLQRGTSSTNLCSTSASPSPRAPPTRTQSPFTETELHIVKKSNEAQKEQIGNQIQSVHNTVQDLLHGHNRLQQQVTWLREKTQTPLPRSATTDNNKERIYVCECAVDEMKRRLDDLSDSIRTADINTKASLNDVNFKQRDDVQRTSHRLVDMEKTLRDHTTAISQRLADVERASNATATNTHQHEDVQNMREQMT
eukprot:PhM_4_TR3805/c0_g2_i1/m.40193